MPENPTFLYQLLALRGTETFFRIFLIIDYNCAVSLLHQIIILSINKIKHPFYYNEIDENIDKNNNEKKNEITKNLIIEIDKLNDKNEVIIQNRKKSLIIINEMVQNEIELKNGIEDYYIILKSKIIHKLLNN